MIQGVTVQGAQARGATVQAVVRVVDLHRALLVSLALGTAMVMVSLVMAMVSLAMVMVSLAMATQATL